MALRLDFQKAKLLHEGETAKAFKKEDFKEKFALGGKSLQMRL